MSGDVEAGCDFHEDMDAFGRPIGGRCGASVAYRVSWKDGRWSRVCEKHAAEVLPPIADLIEQIIPGGDVEKAIDDDPAWCAECGCPIGVGSCAGCVAVASLDAADPDEPRCEHCGKPLYEFADLGCAYCDARHPGFGVL